MAGDGSAAETAAVQQHLHEVLAHHALRNAKVARDRGLRLASSR